MKIMLILTTLLVTALIFGKTKTRPSSSKTEAKIIKLPAPAYESQTSVEEALKIRRSVREYEKESLTLTQLSQMLWAAQGITRGNSYRTAPSAGALYPLETYVVVGDVHGLPAGVYKYDPHRHGLTLEQEGDKRKTLAHAAVLQNWMAKAPALIVMAAVYRRTTIKYGPRGKRYVHMEVGHAAQNVYLQATSMDLGTVMVGAFMDEVVKKILALKKEEEPLAIMPIGKQK
ncbi:MAG: SagB/ThcOx family dehydrogenase [Cyclobacteriaceae bacterium]